MIRYFFVTLLFLAVGIIAQQWIYGASVTPFGVPILIIPALFLCISCAQSYTNTLIFAVLAGFIWDADHTLTSFQLPFQLAENRDIATPDNLRFGYSIFLFGLTGFFIKFIQASLPIRGLFINTLLVALSFLLYLIMEATLFCFIQGSFPTNFSILLFITKTVGISSIIAPFCLYFLGLIWLKITPDERPLPADLTRVLSKKTRYES